MHEDIGSAVLYDEHTDLVCTHILGTLSENSYRSVISRLALERLHRKCYAIWRICDHHLGD